MGAYAFERFNIIDVDSIKLVGVELLLKGIAWTDFEFKFHTCFNPLFHE